MQMGPLAVPGDDYNNLLTAGALLTAGSLHQSQLGLRLRPSEGGWRRTGPRQSDVISGPDLTPISDPPGGAGVLQANGGITPMRLFLQELDSGSCLAQDVAGAPASPSPHVPWCPPGLRGPESTQSVFAGSVDPLGSAGPRSAGWEAFGSFLSRGRDVGGRLYKLCEPDRHQQSSEERRRDTSRTVSCSEDTKQTSNQELRVGEEGPGLRMTNHLSCNSSPMPRGRAWNP